MLVLAGYLIVAFISAVIVSSLYISRIRDILKKQEEEIRKHAKAGFEDGWIQGCRYAANAGDEMRETILKEKIESWPDRTQY